MLGLGLGLHRSGTELSKAGAAVGQSLWQALPFTIAPIGARQNNFQENTLEDHIHLGGATTVTREIYMYKKALSRSMIIRVSYQPFAAG
jgi:hypothetical protein